MTTPTEPGAGTGKPVDDLAAVRRETRSQAVILGAAFGFVLLLLAAAVIGGWLLLR